MASGKETISKSAMFMVLCALGTAFFHAPARAETIESFYKGKTITIVVSTGVGGVTDLTARTGREISAEIHSRQACRNREEHAGSGHVPATNFMFSEAAKDGTFMAPVNNGMPLHQ
jgi:tripartite-type tricarboxylate transporter receptor subunit TctC